ncbi:hypothetical protein GGI03_002975 [Coemansia sp. RSA 2337]|nr:hypothetical protein GGI03_002975 [Coemansia sp. RSA 2337]
MCVHMDKLCHITKTVNISMCLYDLVSGRAAHMLAQSPFSSSVFEAVRRVRINFDKESDLASFPIHFDVNAYHEKNSIFEEPNGKPVAYHRLKFLRLFNITNTSSSKYSGKSPTFILPRLSQLIMLGNFPFRDGALFKSVSSTLVSVRISTTMSLLDIINRFNVFSDTCCPHVNYISIFSTWDRFYIERYNAYYLFLSTVSRRLKTLKVANAYVTDIFMDLVMNVHVIDTIQSLSIDGTVLSFSSLCSLIESLPQMTQLRFQSIEVYEDYDIPDAIGLYEQIIEKWAVLSTSLKFCQVIHHDPQDTTNDLAICGILLSILCPRFTRLIVSSTARGRYDSFVRKAIQQEPFSRYAERLSRLMFNDTPKL